MIIWITIERSKRQVNWLPPMTDSLKFKVNEYLWLLMFLREISDRMSRTANLMNKQKMRVIQIIRQFKLKQKVNTQKCAAAIVPKNYSFNRLKCALLHHVRRSMRRAFHAPVWNGPKIAGKIFWPTPIRTMHAVLVGEINDWKSVGQHYTA